MAKQVITITITDCENSTGQNGIDCQLHVEGEYETGSFSHLMAVALNEKFKAIIDCTSEYVQEQQERKSRSAISLTRSIH